MEGPVEKAIMKKDERIVKKVGDKYIMELVQVQEYNQNQVNKMLEDWQKAKEGYQIWLDNFDKHIEAGVKDLKYQLEIQKQKIEMDMKFIEEGIELWSNPQDGN